MVKRSVLLLGAALAALLTTVSLAGFGAHSSAPEDAVEAAVVRDAALGAQPWIPCTSGRPAVLTAAVVRAQRAALADTVARTYALGESTHASTLAHLQSLVERYGPDGAGVRGGDRLCEPGGGVDGVSVVSFSLSGATASMTIQFHVWNEVEGVANGTPFHYRPENRAQITDRLAQFGGAWLVTQRGAPDFLNGSSG